MAVSLEAKGAGETVTRRWPVPVADGDHPATVSISASGVTASATLEGDEVVLELSAGTAGTTASIALTVTTDLGDTLVEKLYLPIVAPDATGMNVRAVCEFALRKVYGKDETPEASAMADAVERLEDMLRTWARSGADVGATFPLSEATVIYTAPSYQAAIKHNLIVQIADLYDLPVSPTVAANAVRGLQHIKALNLSEGRAAAVFY